MLQAAPLLQVLLVSKAVIPVTNMNAAELEMQPLTDQAAAAVFQNNGLVVPSAPFQFESLASTSITQSAATKYNPGSTCSFIKMGCKTTCVEELDLYFLIGRDSCLGAESGMRRSAPQS